jgi:hypothetical protein
MPEFNIDVEFEVWCSCGEGLCGQSEGNNRGRNGSPGVIVEPCQKCLDTAKNEGYENGYQDAEDSCQNMSS